MTASVIVGIDPGVHTGYAELRDGKLLAVESLKLHKAWERVQYGWDCGELKMVVFEDARLRTWFGAEKGRDQLQGAGSIKRDCSAWADFLGDLGCPYKAIAPQRGATKWTAEHFARVTGWQERTNEHGRDAAMLIWGR